MKVFGRSTIVIGANVKPSVESVCIESANNMGLPLRKKLKKRLPKRTQEPIVSSCHFTHT